MELLNEKLSEIDHKLRQVGGKMSLLKRQNMQLLAENVRLKKQLEKNKSNSFAEEGAKSEGDGNIETHGSDLTAGERKIWKQEIEDRSEEHTSELQSRGHLVCRL